MMKWKDFPMQSYCGFKKENFAHTAKFAKDTANDKNSVILPYGLYLCA